MKFTHNINEDARIQRKEDEWIEWKRKGFWPNVTPIVTYTLWDEKTGESSKKISFATKANPLFSEYHQLFYNGEKKEISVKLFDLFKNPISLAIWYLDNGGMRANGKGYFFYTNDFSLWDTMTLQQILWKNFQFKTTFHEIEKGYILEIKSGQEERFYKLIQPLVDSMVPDMQYKFYEPCTDLKLKISPLPLFFLPV
jgi:hypothetical protein